MYITRVPNRGYQLEVLLRESYRDGGKVKNRHWPTFVLEGGQGGEAGPGAERPAPGRAEDMIEITAACSKGTWPRCWVRYARWAWRS